MTLGLNFGHKTSENSVEKVTILQYTLSHLPLIVDGLGPAEEGVDVDFMYTHVDNDRDVEGLIRRGPSLGGYGIILKMIFLKILPFARLVVKRQRAAGKKMQQATYVLFEETSERALRLGSAFLDILSSYSTCNRLKTSI